MTNLRLLSRWLVFSSLLAASVSACGDDDDDSGGNHSAGSSTAGRSGAATGGSSNEAGAPSRGGTSTEPGTGGTPDEAAGAAGAGGAQSAAGSAGAENAAGAGGAENAAIAALSDAQILLVLDTLNQGEVEEAYAALPRLAVPDVEAFAQQMITDHGSARQSVLATGESLELSPMPSPVQADLKEESEAHVATLRVAPATSVDETYIGLEVAAHADALSLLKQLDAAADAAELRTLIGTLSATVQDHYDSATSIQADL